MSHVKAYICNYDNHLIPDKDAVGIIPQEDLFNRMLSYPMVFTPAKIDKTDCHCCTDCYRKVVLIPAANQADRKKDEKGYELKIKELGFSFRETCVKRWRLRKKDPK